MAPIVVPQDHREPKRLRRMPVRHCLASGLTQVQAGDTLDSLTVKAVTVNRVAGYPVHGLDGELFGGLHGHYTLQLFIGIIKYIDVLAHQRVLLSHGRQAFAEANFHKENLDVDFGQGSNSN